METDKDELKSAGTKREYVVPTRREWDGARMGAKVPVLLVCVVTSAACW